MKQKKPGLWKRFTSLLADNSPLMCTIGKIAMLVFLNLIWLICCLPLVTIGASCAALEDSLSDFDGLTYSGLVPGFFRAFRRHLVPATLLWLIAAAAGSLLFLDFRLADRQGLLSTFSGCFLLFLACFVFFLFFSCLFPALILLHRGLWETVKCAFLAGLGFLPQSVPAAILEGIPVILLCANPALFVKLWMVWVLIGGSAVALAKLTLLRPVMEKFHQSDD